jgi:hypothetical protein
VLLSCSAWIPGGLVHHNDFVVVTADELITERLRRRETLLESRAGFPRITGSSVVPFRYRSEQVRITEGAKQSRVVKARDSGTALSEPLVPLLDELLGLAIRDPPKTRCPRAFAHRALLSLAIPPAALFLHSSQLAG